MKSLLLLLLFAIFSFILCEPEGTAEQQSSESSTPSQIDNYLLGEWIVPKTNFKINFFANGTFAASLWDLPSIREKYTVDLTKSPHWINMDMPVGSVKGIYVNWTSFDGLKELHLALSPYGWPFGDASDADRPTNISSTNSFPFYGGSAPKNLTGTGESSTGGSSTGGSSTSGSSTGGSSTGGSPSAETCTDCKNNCVSSCRVAKKLASQCTDACKYSICNLVLKCPTK